MDQIRGLTLASQVRNYMIKGLVTTIHTYPSHSAVRQNSADEIDQDERASGGTTSNILPFPTPADAVSLSTRTRYPISIVFLP